METTHEALGANSGRDTGTDTTHDGCLRIGVDFDGVLFDHVPYVLRGFRDRYGIDLGEEGLRHWDFYHYKAVQDADLPPSKVHGLLRDIETDPLLHEEPPRDGAAAAVMQAWVAAGHEVHVVTARGRHAEAATRHFLARHGIPHSGLVMEAKVKTGWDVLVDDAPHNVLMAAADGGIALLMDHPYNRDVPTHTNPRRVLDWREVGQVVAGLRMGEVAVARDARQGIVANGLHAPPAVASVPRATTPLLSVNA